MQNTIYAISYVGLFVAYILAMFIWTQSGNHKLLKRDVERLEKEQLDRWKKDSDLREFVYRQVREVRVEMHKQITDLGEHLTREFKPERTKSMAHEILKRMQEEWMKQLDDRVDKLEKHNNEAEEKELKESVKKLRSITLKEDEAAN